MGLLGGIRFDSLQDLYLNQLQDLYDAEKRILAALPKMADAAASSDLRQAFTEHQRQTQEHITRLEQIFRQMGREPKRETCEGIKGILDEGDELINAEGDNMVRDAALIAAAQRVEHYEIAAYGTVRSLAQRLNQPEAVSLLQQTLNEEGDTDKMLTRIAESHVNREARAA
ncbi:MAG TPA: ferritin-like domain-containing protein [Phycisphaeraceae bacterium]